MLDWAAAHCGYAHAARVDSPIWTDASPRPPAPGPPLRDGRLFKGPAGASLPVPESHASDRSRTATVAKFAGDEHTLSDELGECIQADLRYM